MTKVSQNKYQAGIGVKFLGQEIPNLYDPYMQYYCTVWVFFLLDNFMIYKHVHAGRHQKHMMITKWNGL